MDNPRSKQWLYWLLVPLALLLLVPCVVLLNTGELTHQAYWQGQLPLFLAINGWATSLPAGFLYNITLMGDASILLPVAMLALYKCPKTIGALVATLPIGALLSSIGKKLLAMPRPGAVLESTEFHAIGELLTGHSSLPSGHSLTYFAVGIALLVTWRPIWRTGRDKLIGMAAILVLFDMCLSRVAVGAHWPLDLIVGASLGTMAGWAGATIAIKYQGWWHSLVYGKARWGLMAGMLIWAVALMLRSPEMPYMPVTLYMAVVACLAVLYRLMTMTRPV